MSGREKETGKERGREGKREREREREREKESRVPGSRHPIGPYSSPMPRAP